MGTLGEPWGVNNEVEFRIETDTPTPTHTHTDTKTLELVELRLHS